MMSWSGEYPDPNTMRQLLQLLQGLVPPVSVSAQFSPVTPQPSCTPADMAVALQSLLARASVWQLQSAVMQSALLQIMPQAFQMAAPSAHPQTSVLPAAAQHLSTPASSNSSAIQLPQMEVSVAREMLVQLVQQLQQAGQLPHGDIIKRLLQPSADTSSHQHVPPVKVKKDDPASEQSDEKPLCVIWKTESLAEAKSEPPRAYMDIAEDNNYSVSAASTEGDVGRGLDGRSDEAEGVDRPRKMAKSRQPVEQRDVPVPQRPHESSLSTSCNDSDPQLQKKCVVKLGKVDTARKAVSTPPEPMGTASMQRSKPPEPVGTSSAQSSMPLEQASTASVQRSMLPAAVSTPSVERSTAPKPMGTSSMQRSMPPEPMGTSSAQSSMPLEQASNDSLQRSMLPAPVSTPSVERSTAPEPMGTSSMQRSMPPEPMGTSSAQSSMPLEQASTTSLRLKNMKNYRYNNCSHILQSTSNSEAQSPAVTTASSREPAAQKSAPQANKVPVDQQQQPTGTSPPGVGTSRNMFGIFAQRTSGRGVNQEEPVAEVKPSDPLPASVGVSLQRSVNAAHDKTMSLRTLCFDGGSESAEWMSLVSSVFSAGTKDRTFVQCSFCPRLGQYPTDVPSHINAEHRDLRFALAKPKPAAGPPVYIKCRHCNYVTVDSTLAWIHFDTHHCVSDILGCDDRAAHLDLSGPDMPEVFVDIDSVMGSKTAFVCFDCSAVNVDTDTAASSMLMVRHVARHHPNSDYCNGNVVKLMMLDPAAINGSPTYRQAMTDREHVHGRREIFMCMFCR